LGQRLIRRHGLGTDGVRDASTVYAAPEAALAIEDVEAGPAVGEAVTSATVLAE
jgi:hypothetical protein